MATGKLEVFLDSAQDLENTDLLHKMDPYVIIRYGTQEQKSRIAFRHGSEPKWKQTFTFPVSDGVQGLWIKIMDNDTNTDDDLVGEAKISLERLFLEGSVPPKPYIVVKNREYCGDIIIGLTFIPDQEENDEAQEEESCGGWEESSCS